MLDNITVSGNEADLSDEEALELLDEALRILAQNVVAELGHVR